MTPRIMTFKVQGEPFTYFCTRMINDASPYCIYTVLLADVEYPDIQSDDRFLGFTYEEQKYKVSVAQDFLITGTPIGAAMDCLEWFDGVLAFIAQNPAIWSLKVNDGPGPIDFTFSFLDLTAATLFRLRF